MLRTGLSLAIVALCALGCVHRPLTRPVAVSARPFDAMPSVTLADHAQLGPMYRVQIAAEITRDVMPTDDLAIVVSVGDLEVGRYPVVGRFERRPTRIQQEIELPLGDYEIDLVYQGQTYAGMPFRLAEVPVWGGRKALQLRVHPGTRVSLREQRLWVGRWWANDGPPQAWIVEWVHEGKVATTTSGREQHGMAASASRIVGGAVGAYREARLVHNTIWTYGEEYPLPAMVATTPGVWAARVVHGNAAPISVVFTVLPGARLAEASPRRIAQAGWEPSWSHRLEQRAIAVTEVERLSAKLPRLGASQPFDEPGARASELEPHVRVSTAAVRALFRSRALAELWWQFLELDRSDTAAGGRSEPLTAFPSSRAGGRRTAGLGGGRRGGGKDAGGRDGVPGERRTRLRAQIEQLIKQHGGAWTPDEFPRS